MRRPLFEPASASVANVLERMRRDGAHMVLIVDELGAFAGIVTLEDIMEELVGEIRSETGYEERRQTHRGQSRWVVDGSRELSGLVTDLGTDLSEPGASTVGGLLLSRLRRMARAGDAIEIDNFRMSVAKADERRVIEVTIERLDEEDDTPEMSMEGPGQ